VTLEAGTVVGGYVVEGVLGRGGMATVYSARHGEQGRRVALKVLAGERNGDHDRDAREAFQRSDSQVAVAVPVGEKGLTLPLGLEQAGELGRRQRVRGGAIAAACARQKSI
jgi:serine/threonine protein kinase